MTLNERLNSLLAEEYADYQVLPPDDAKSSRVLSRGERTGEAAEVSVVRDDSGQLSMVVLPAGERLDLAALARRMGRARLWPATAEECPALLADGGPETAPPFGKLYGMTTFVDACFRDEPWIVFHGGSRGELIRMRFQDYRAVANAVTGQWCFHTQRQAA